MSAYKWVMPKSKNTCRCCYKKSEIMTQEAYARYCAVVSELTTLVPINKFAYTELYEKALGEALGRFDESMDNLRFSDINLILSHAFCDEAGYRQLSGRLNVGTVIILGRNHSKLADLMGQICRRFKTNLSRYCSSRAYLDKTHRDDFFYLLGNMEIYTIPNSRTKVLKCQMDQALNFYLLGRNQYQLHLNDREFVTEIATLIDRFEVYTKELFPDGVHSDDHDFGEHNSIKNYMASIDDYNFEAFDYVNTLVRKCLSDQLFAANVCGLSNWSLLVNTSPARLKSTLGRFYKNMLKHMHEFIVNSRKPIPPLGIRYIADRLTELNMFSSYRKVDRLMQNRYYKLSEAGKLDGLAPQEKWRRCMVDYLESIIGNNTGEGPAYSHLRLLIERALFMVNGLRTKSKGEVTVYYLPDNDTRFVAVFNHFQSMYEFADSNVDRVLDLLMVPHMLSSIRSLGVPHKFGLSRHFIVGSKAYNEIKEINGPYFDELNNFDILDKNSGVELRSYMGYRSAILMRLVNSSKESVLKRLLTVFVSYDRACEIVDTVMASLPETHESVGFKKKTHEEWLAQIDAFVKQNLTPMGERRLSGGKEHAVLEQSTCLICLETLEPEKCTMICTNVHFLCNDCVKHMSVLRNKCPMCRTKINIK